VYGAGKPALILLHGFGAGVFSWQAVVPSLAGLGTVVAFDRPGFGLTERRLPDRHGRYAGGNPYTAEAQVELLFGLMDQLGIEQAVLVGHSAGGTVALNAALARPQRVRALVLVDAAVYSSGGAPDWVLPVLKTPQMNRLGPLAARWVVNARADDFLDRSWHAPGAIPPTLRRAYHQAFQVHHWDRSLWELVKVFRTPHAAQRLNEVNLPALVITGDDDRVVATADSLRLARELPGAKLALFKNCGHTPQEECPERFLEEIIPFIQSL
jgi:pimeloyl-ACP methyl ester carboxylesterase